MSKLVMGYWDCPVCGNREIRGDVVNCPSCGRARGDVKFYVKGYSEGDSLRESELSHFEQLDDQKAEEMGKNPDWYCSFCNSLNSDKLQTCSNCGAQVMYHHVCPECGYYRGKLAIAKGEQE